MRKVRIIAAGLALGLASATALTSPALAADYPVLRGSQYEPQPTPMGTTTSSNGIDWSGFTILGHAGLSRSYFDFDTSLQTLAAQPLRQSHLLTNTTRRAGSTPAPAKIAALRSARLSATTT